MKHDPFYNQIVSGLKGSLDEANFEACAVELIRADGFAIVPVKGGADGGMDGAVADGDSEAYPLVVTTSNRCVENLRKNLNQYVNTGGKNRKVIFATSQALSPKKQKTLREATAELGFTMVQIYEQAGIAARLYRDSAWCKELLHLTGEPSALSIIPLSNRPIADYDLIGREKIYNWMTDTKGDKLIAGEPGSGKTALLSKFAQKNIALFVVDNDKTKIANAVRQQKPDYIIVDDAHVDPNFLKLLAHLRNEIRAEFKIIATCWTGDVETVSEILQIPSSHTLELERLTRDQMVKVVEVAGIRDVTWLVREIITQSEGLPGLAVTLTNLCLQGDIKQIHTADALSRTVMQFYTKHIEKSVQDILAAFSIGGAAGMSKSNIGQILTIPPMELRQILATLATGGVVTQVGFDTDTLMVRPAALRHALIRDVFFSGASALPQAILEQLLEKTPNTIETTRELIHVKARRGNVPQHLLQYRLINLPTSWELWEAYASLGFNEANWVLDNFADTIVKFAFAVLENSPQRAIPRLLSEAIGDNRLLNANPEHPLRRIQDWVHKPYSGTEPIKRRKILLESAEEWLLSENDVAVGYKALLYAVNPSFEFHTSDPGSGNTFNLYSGYLTVTELVELQAFWKRIILLSEKIRVTDWKPFLELLDKWDYPHLQHSEDVGDVMRTFSKTIAQDIMTAAANKPSVIYELKKLFKLPINQIREYEVLFPTKDYNENWGEQDAKWSEDVKNLANEWKERKPQVNVEFLADIEYEMSQARHVHPRLTPSLCYFLAETTTLHIEYVKAIINAGLKSDLLSPFLNKIIGQAGWEEIIKTCMQNSHFKAIAVQIIITTPNMPESLISQALSSLSDFPQLIEYRYLLDKIPNGLIIRLLTYSDKTVASTVAFAEWQHQPNRKVRDWLRKEWEAAILQSKDDYWLSEIFKSESNLAFQWLKQNLYSQEFKSYLYDETVRTAIASLSIVERQELLVNLPKGWHYYDVVTQLIGDEIELYSLLLKIDSLKEFHLTPLYKDINDVWQAQAKLAEANGYTVKEIVARTITPIGVVQTWTGRLSEQWKAWVEKFKALQANPDSVIRDIAIAGTEICQQEYEKELKREHTKDVYGID
jgi:hypothetical protein